MGNSKRVPIALLLALAVPALAFGAYWFAPWKLFVDEHVDEAPPGLVAPAMAAAARASRVISSGAFRGLEHETTGAAEVIEGADGALTLRLEDLRTSNGPELVVILSPTPATTDSWTVYGKGDILTLGPLKGNVGSQNYAIPAGTDLSRYRSAVVWCRRFSVAFGAAPLAASLATP
jgi:hypothetical protein